jgi:hypothetical protein
MLNLKFLLPIIIIFNFGSMAAWEQNDSLFKVVKKLQEDRERREFAMEAYLAQKIESQLVEAETEELLKVCLDLIRGDLGLITDQSTISGLCNLLFKSQTQSSIENEIRDLAKKDLDLAENLHFVACQKCHKKLNNFNKIIF